MAHFEANFYAMTVGTSNCWTVNMKLLTRTVQTEAIENFGNEKVRTNNLRKERRRNGSDGRSGASSDISALILVFVGLYR